jgi:glycosyltransferase involved in cell wall biosynthesis
MPNRELPFVSIGIPVYNGENYLLESIKSALGQNYPNFELLIVDNCSTDRTEAIVSELNDSRVRYIRNEKNIGSIGNFNKCIELAKGEYFLLLPHDDLLLPDSISKYAKGFEDPSVGFVYSSIRVVNANGEVIHNKINHGVNKLFSSKEIITDIVDNFVPIQLAMARTSILQRLGGFDIQYSVLSDVHLWSKVAFDGWKALYHKEALFCHRKHAEQGQIAFFKPNLKTLSMHWGKKLDKKFWIENSYNYLFLKLSHYLFLEMDAHYYNAYHAKIELLKVFAFSHFKDILRGTVRMNFSILIRDLLIFKPLIKQFSFRNVLLFYPLGILKGIVRKLTKYCRRHLRECS